MVMEMDQHNGERVNGNGALAKSKPATAVIRDSSGRWVKGTASPTLGRRRDPAERIRQRILDSIENATGAESLEHILEEVAKTRPLEYFKLVLSFVAPAKATAKNKPAGGLNLDLLLSDLERRHAQVASEAKPVTLLDADDEPRADRSAPRGSAEPTSPA